jgi:hypothetical protein
MSGKGSIAVMKKCTNTLCMYTEGEYKLFKAIDVIVRLDARSFAA